MSALATQVDLYFATVLAHAAVPDAVVSSYLTLARAALASEAVWGAVYDQACVWWAASKLDPVVASGAFPASGGCVPEEPVDPRKLPPRPDYWKFFQDLQASRAASGPLWVGPC